MTTKHQAVLNRQKEIIDNLKEYLYTNRGRRSTRESDASILAVADKLLILGYNEAYYELKGL